MVESVARVRHIRVTPMKARRVVNLIRESRLTKPRDSEARTSDRFRARIQACCFGNRNARVKADAANAFLDEQDLFVSEALSTRVQP
jgi:large subunit ribosomal protein L22